MFIFFKFVDYYDVIFRTISLLTIMGGLFSSEPTEDAGEN